MTEEEAGCFLFGILIGWTALCIVVGVLIGLNVIR